MQKLKLEDPNKSKLSRAWLHAVVAALSDKYGVEIEEGRDWSMDIKRKRLVYNDQILWLEKDDVLALLMHEIGHLKYTCSVDSDTQVFKEAPESSLSAINFLEDFRIDFTMSHEYINSGNLMAKFNEHAISIAYEQISKLQNMQNAYDGKFSAIKKEISDRIDDLTNKGVPFTKPDELHEFSQILDQIGHRPRTERFVDEIMMLSTLLYYANNNPERYDILKNYKNQEYLKLAQQILPIYKDTVETLPTTLDVQKMWENDIYPILKSEIDKDQKQSQHQAPTPNTPDGAISNSVGGAESEQQSPIRSVQSNSGIQDSHSARGLKSRLQEKSEGQKESFTKSYSKKGESTNEQVRWDKFKRDVKHYLSTAKTQMSRILKENETQRYAGRHRSGALNIKKLYKFPLRDYRLFQRQTEIKGRDYAFSVLVDVSGSMQGSSLNETMKGVVLLSETLYKLEQPFELTFFSSQHNTPKTFTTVLDPIEIGFKASKVIGGGTNIESPYKQCFKRLSEQKTKEKIMITLTDGEFGESEKKMIKAEIAKNKNIKQYGIGVNVSLTDIFGDTAINIKNVSDIMPMFAKIMRNHIKKLS